nr:oligopeptide/dipeptide ABC transporter ATP-binding protein [Pseudarthrobacter sp. NBSH8]
MSAAPELRKNDGTDRERIVLQGDPPSPIDPPPGCRFHTRCPMAQAICAPEEQELIQICDTHVSRCHFAQQVSTGS